MDKIETKKCKECEKLFEKKIDCSYFNWEIKKYCSQLCASRGKSKNMKGICFNTGRTHIKKGQRLSPTTEFKKGLIPWSKGKKLLYITGEKNNKWKGGITPEHQKIRHSPEMKELRLKAFKRDNYTCKDCGRKSKPGDKVILEIHHIKPFAVHKELRFDMDNVITLCRECHLKTDTWGKNTTI